MAMDYLQRLHGDGVNDREIERLKQAPVFGRAAMKHIEEGTGWLAEGIALFENPPEEHLPNGADVDEMKDTVIAYLDAASGILRRESDVEEDETTYIEVDLSLPKPGFLGAEVTPYAFRVELCKFFESARREYPYWRVAFPFWEARVDADESGGECAECVAWMRSFGNVDVANALDDGTGYHLVDADTVEFVFRRSGR